MPVAHALLQARFEVGLLQDLDEIMVWARPGGAASIAFHLQHLAGTLDRLCTYARGERLSGAQREVLSAERDGGDHTLSTSDMVRRVEETIDAAMDQLRATDASTLAEERRLGKAQLPTTVIGLLFHAAEHATRHLGQIVTTLKVLRGSVAPS
jgi:uncharacterized damage-inducible protein DinB